MVEEIAQLRVNEFHKRHGAECYHYDGFYWYADGAYRDEHVLGVMVEPPADVETRHGEYELLHRKLNHFKAKHNRAVGQFEDLRESFATSIPNDDGADALRELKALRRSVETSREELRQAQNALDESSLGKQRKAAREARQEEQARIDRWFAELKKVRI
jgi:hypothetical protein